MKQIRLLAVGFLALFSLLAFSGCGGSDGGGSGTVNLNLADAPIDDENVTGVYITINEIRYHHDGGWHTMVDFEGPKTYNLFDLREGNFTELGSLTLDAGEYHEFRFVLDASDKEKGDSANPGCYLSFNDGRADEPLFVPSGSTSGFKVKGGVIVPADGNISVTADFNVRKSVVEAGNSGKYILKPVIRLVDHSLVGEINGSVVNESDYPSLVVYAYDDGSWDESEADDPAPETPRFPNAITSTGVSEGSYIIPWLTQGVYDLVVAGNNADGSFGAVLGFIGDVTVTADQTTTQDINTSDLSPSL
jgi:hypothetical protein